MIELEEANQRILETICATEAEVATLSIAASRILAADLKAAINLPAFDNSAMDGYAVCASDASTGACLQQIGEVPAGTAFEGEVGQGECVRIFTGSSMPTGANAVVMQEDTRADGNTIKVIDGV